MPRITAVRTHTPRYRASQEEVKAFARSHFEGHLPGLDRLLRVFDSAQVDERQLTHPIPWHGKARSWAEQGAAFHDAALALSGELVERLLDEAGFLPTDFDAIVYVNSTGISTPSIDAALANRFGFKSGIRRTPVWGLGCAGGAAGVALARDHALANPSHRSLVINLELCAQTFRPDDFSVANLIATALFGDGLAATVVEGDQCDGSGGVEIVANASTLYEDTLGAMGWRIGEDGLQVVFERRIPRLVRDTSREHFDDLLAGASWHLGAIENWLVHPGGPRVLDAYEQAIGIDREATALSRRVLRSHGNMSSATVIFVLEAFLEARAQGKGVLSAFGPGFSANSVLLDFG